MATIYDLSDHNYGIRLLVSDFRASFRFYRDTLGLELTWGEESGPYADFKTESDSYLSLFSRNLMAEALGADKLPPAVASQDKFAIIVQVGTWMRLSNI